MIWESLTEMLGANIKLTSPYYPQGNSVIERSHRTLSNMLRTMLLEKKGRDWSSLLPSVMLYMNSMIQEKTEFLPARFYWVIILIFLRISPTHLSLLCQTIEKVM